MSDDYVDRIRSILDAHNIPTYRFIHRRRHRSVVVTRGGKTITVTFPTSPSDWRGPRKCEADVRWALQVAS